MKILLSGSTSPDSGDAPLLLKKAFEKQGHEARLFSASEDKPFWAEVASQTGNKIMTFIISSFSRRIHQIAREWRPDLVLLYGSNVFVSAATIQKMRRELKCKVALWEVNNYCFRGYQAESIPYYDAVFTLDSYLLPLLRINGVKNAHYLPACIDPEEHYPIKLSEEDRARFSADVSMIGSAYPTRVEIIRHLTDYNLRLYGAGWKKDPQFAPFIFEDPALDVGKLKIFAGSRISINIHGPHMINGENYRVYEAAACGGACMSLYKPDLVKSFEPEKEVILFNNADDLRAKLDIYLANPDKLREIADSAHRRVLAEHTYQHRVEALMKAL